MLEYSVIFQHFFLVYYPVIAFVIAATTGTATLHYFGVVLFVAVYCSRVMVDCCYDFCGRALLHGVGYASEPTK